MSTTPIRTFHVPRRPTPTGEDVASESSLFHNPFLHESLTPFSATIPPPLSLRIISHIESLVAGEIRTVTCLSGEGIHLIKVDGIGEFALTSTGEEIALIHTDLDLASTLLAETLIGPPLVLALALQGVYSLHASAALFEEGAVAFLGDSGAGKSTLTRHLHHTDDSRWQRISDDLLPVTNDVSGMIALPRFPQLKLPPQEQVNYSLPAQIPFSVVFLLAEGEEVSIESLSKGELTISLIRHTMATSLFDKRLLSKHLAFCSTVALSIPAYRLSYPRRAESLPKVCEFIQTQIRLFYGSS